MPAFQTVHRVHHKPRDMFDIVADIRAYPEFVPMCTGILVRSEQERRGKSVVIADMSVGYKQISETFTSQVILDDDLLEINTKYIDGPFKYLHNRWRFLKSDLTEDAEYCDVDFSIDYEFKNKVLGMVMGVMFERAFSRFTGAFEARADEKYGA
jgi:coenzyme Q-binding protein COQ10